MAREKKQFYQCTLIGKRNSIRDKDIDTSSGKTVYVLRKHARVGRIVQVLKNEVEIPSFPINKNEWEHWEISSVGNNIVMGSALTERQRITCGYPEGRG